MIIFPGMTGLTAGEGFNPSSAVNPVMPGRILPLTIPGVVTILITHGCNKVRYNRGWKHEMCFCGSEETAMSANSRLSLAVHTLTWMAKFKDEYEYATSERMARSVNTNPVILRGLLGMMEKQHLVCVQRGSNAGWKLARTPEEITLLDVYRAVKPHSLFAL